MSNSSKINILIYIYIYIYINIYMDVLQFGYESCSSITICTTLLLETIDYYHENRSDCFLLLLDASKAFGGIEYVKLFQTPHDRKICPTVLRLIMHLYVNQKILIRWNQLLSHTCAISNGFNSL